MRQEPRDSRRLWGEAVLAWEQLDQAQPLLLTCCTPHPDVHARHDRPRLCPHPEYRQTCSWLAPRLKREMTSHWNLNFTTHPDSRRAPRSFKACRLNDSSGSFIWALRSGYIMSMAEPTSKGPRGNYSRFRCLNCRSRKIKCQLPEDYSSPEACGTGEARCKRCKTLDLDCVVEKTVLGRPAAKRKRTNAPMGEDEDDETPLVDSSTDRVVFDPHLNEYLLCNVTDDGISSSSTVTPNAQNKHEALDTLVSPAHFVAAVLTHDTIFAANIATTSGCGNEDLLDLVSSGLAALLDDQYDM